MAHDRELADRVRGALAGRPSVREVPMFGGLSFMVDDRMVVSVGRDGDLLVRADPEAADRLLATRGAQPAEMGPGRVMGGGWISVTREAIAADDAFASWIAVALAYHDKVDAGPRRRGGRK